MYKQISTPSECIIHIDSNTCSATPAELFSELHQSKVHHVLETAMIDDKKQSIPTLSVGFRDLSVSAIVAVDKQGASELPTLWNELKQSVVGCFSPSKTTEVTILNKLTGFFQPQTMTLILGQSGSGKSTLMKVLSGRFPMDKNISVSGEIKYNGIPQQEIEQVLPQFVGYVNQTDAHHPTLTVQENLQFAHRCCMGEKVPEWLSSKLNGGTEEQNQQARNLSDALHKFYPELVLKTFGLENCKDTVVGDAMLRGVSGGERKRVTAAEMSFGMRSVSLMDEISTGLDSAATFDICESLKRYAKDFQETVAISLLQPPPEVFNLFDNVIVMNSGHIIYNGPRDLVLNYFERLGFKCPPHRDVADFLLDIGTDRQIQYEVIPREVTQSLPSTGEEFAKCFEDSSICKSLIDEVEGCWNSYTSSELISNKKQLKERNEFQQNFGKSTIALIKRSAMVTKRNTAFLKGRAFMILLMGLLYGVMFFDSDSTKPQVIIGLLFSTVLFLSLGQASLLSTFMAEREVFYKQRGANFFRTSSYVLSSSLAQLPFAVVEAIVFGSVVYWTAGFASYAENFINFEVILILTNLAMGAWFFFLSSIAPNGMVGEPLSMVSILFFVLFSGFVITKDNMPDYFIWIYWINPVAWSIRSLAVNQYTAGEFELDCKYLSYCETGTSGEYFLSIYGVPSEKFWIISGMVYTFLIYILFMFFSYLVLEYNRYESPENVSVPSQDEDDGTVILSPRESSRRYSESRCALNTRERVVSPVTLAFKDLWYSVQVADGSEIDLLKGISGFALPGTMTALMGSSGAGKTTLMDVIAGRKTGGKIQGQILLNGHEANELAIRRCTGYCEQMDNHSESATIREAIVFSAFLRQSAELSDEVKMESVNEVLDILELRHVADQIIRGSSKELMKRLTIGVELAAQPSVLFLDEPTSGLDARSAQIIMAGVRKIADSGRTVVCTIHQPSLEVFRVFDSLLLLKRGGQTVYFGDIGSNSETLIKYFEDIPSTPFIEQGYNPATWMLEVIGAGVGKEENIDYASLFEKSDRRTILENNLNVPGVSFPSDSSFEMKFSAKRASSNIVQFKLLCSRFMNMYWRSPSYNLTRLAMNIVISLLLGLIYVGTDYSTFSGINSGMGLVFLATVFSGLIAFESVLPIAVEDRTAFYRERACQSYNALWYFVGSTIVEIPYVFCSTLVFVCIFYPFVGFFGYYECFLFWVVFMLFILMQVYFGLFMAYLLPSVDVAALLGVLINSIFILFMGFNPSVENIPRFLKWIYFLTPQSYCLSALGSIVFGKDSVIGRKLIRNLPPGFEHGLTVSKYVDHEFQVNIEDLWQNVGVMIGFIVFFRLIGLVALRFVNHQKR